MNYTKNNYFNLVIIFLISSMSILMIFGISNFLHENRDNDLVEITEAIDNALITSYALEGAYPSDIYELSNYGIIFNNEYYNYDYDFIGYNIKPTVIVTRNIDRHIEK